MGNRDREVAFRCGRVSRVAKVPVQAVTFDFYDTLVCHRAEIGRGRSFEEYLSRAGLTSDPWQHQVLYDVFEYYGACYSPALTEDAKLCFWSEFARRLFVRTNVQPRSRIDYSAHGPAMRDIMGPRCLALFEESLPVLQMLRESRLRLGVISDWQEGLAHFCDELGIGEHLDVVVASADVGYEKPDSRLFEAARRRLNLPPHAILHVGDRLADVEGAKAAGFSAALLVRKGAPPAVDAVVIASLREVPCLLQGTL